MSTPAYVKKLLGQNGTGKKLYRDRIMDDGFSGHFDFLSDYVRNGAVAGAALPVGTQLRNLVEGGAAANVAAAITGGLGARGLILNDASSTVRLPDSFIIPAAETHFAVGVSVRADPAFVYAANSNVSIAAYAYQTGAESQWSFNFTTDGNGAPSGARINLDGATIALPSTAFLTDGKQHFVVGEFEALSSTQARRTAYLDGVAVAQATIAWDGAINQPANAPTVAAGPVIGIGGGFTARMRGSVGRIWCKRWTGDPAAVPCATIAAAEYAAYAARYGL